MLTPRNLWRLKGTPIKYQKFTAENLRCLKVTFTPDVFFSLLVQRLWKKKRINSIYR